MTIRQLARQVAFYLNRSRTALVDENGDDMIISSFNHARKSAEREFWFENAKAEAWLSVTAGSEASLADAKLISSAGAFSETAANVKAVDTLYMGDDTNLSSYVPIYHDSKRLRSIKVREQWSPPTSEEYIDRYRGDYAAPSQTGRYNVVFNGSKFAFLPAFTTTKKLAMDCWLWMDDYVQDRVIVATSSTASTAVTLSAAAPANVGTTTTLLGQLVSSVAGNRLSLTLAGNANATIATPTYTSYTNPFYSAVGNGGEDYEDWFVEHGGDYLLWSAVCQLSLRTNTFARQAQGYNDPPEKARDAALLSLQNWDALHVYRGRLPYRNR